jgi:hypothetical protein
MCTLACVCVCGWARAGYIGDFEIVDDHRSGKIVVQLLGRLNKCGVVSPRFDVKVDELEKWIGNLLPSRQVRARPARAGPARPPARTPRPRRPAARSSA